MSYENAEVKFNGGKGACLCNGCSYILSYGTEHTDVKRYCDDCYGKLELALFNIANMRPHKDSMLEAKRMAREALHNSLELKT